MERNVFLKTLAGITGLSAFGSLKLSAETFAGPAASPLKTSLNAYSFNQALMSGKMDIDGLLDFCAKQGFEAVDITGYYFPGYPKPPSDDYIYHIKRKAFGLGIEISGTGVRNDFTHTDKAKIEESMDLVKSWIDVAAKLGAPVIRVFAGVQEPAAGTRDTIEKQVIEQMKICTEYGKRMGVIVGMQNHNDFIKTGEQALKIIKNVNSEWFGIILDIGSYRIGDPYKQIADTAPFAVNWQIKENMFVDGKEQITDLKKIITIIKASGYKGYIPIETLGAGDPLVKVPAMLEAVKKLI